jgi:Rps23 Pro-64 3,4-dihydroxylase Tpa1-like proline 4-hydroxylase
MSKPLQNLIRYLGADALHRLQFSDYLIIDGALRDRDADALRQEIQTLRPEMSPNCTLVVPPSGSTSPTHFPKEQIMEYDYYKLSAVTDEKIRQRSPADESDKTTPSVQQLREDSTLLELLGDRFGIDRFPLDKQDLKLQWNRGKGGCFPIHFDSDPSIDSRRLTAILYFNPEWREDDGGALKLYPCTPSTPSASPVIVSPKNNRLVLFGSQTMAHRVLPFFGPARYCATLWLSSSDQAAKTALQQDVAKQRLAAKSYLTRCADDPSSIPLIRQDILGIEEIRRHVIKFVHQEEWRQSLIESHPEGPLRDALLSRFDMEISVIERVLSPILTDIPRRSIEHA